MSLEARLVFLGFFLMVEILQLRQPSGGSLSTITSFQTLCTCPESKDLKVLWPKWLCKSVIAIRLGFVMEGNCLGLEGEGTETDLEGKVSVSFCNVRGITQMGKWGSCVTLWQ